MFKWAAGEELVPGSVYVNLQTVEGLRKGRTSAPDHPPVEPVSDTVIEATIPHLPPIVGDMVKLQRLTGTRPGEICSIRPCDIDQSDEVWIYRPRDHKMAYLDRERIIYLGPRAQDILRPYLLRPTDAYCFSPIESEAKRKVAMRMNRKSPVQPSQINRQKSRPKRKPKDHYTKDSYRRAITRSIEKANKMLAESVKLPYWHPHQIRHATATQIRRNFGLEASQIVLGHSNARITEIYAKRDEQRGIDIAKQIG
jgi:integrase